MSNIGPLKQFDLLYLATPYSRYQAGLEAAFQDACSLAGILIMNGIKVYSPIAHTHPIAVHAGIDPSHKFNWLEFDEAMMNACDALVVARMDGWHESIGIDYEIDYFRKYLERPIFYLDPVALEISDGQPVKSTIAEQDVRDFVEAA